MRFGITARPKNKVARLPIQYNAYLQSYLYSIFREKMPFLHDAGFRSENKVFRHYTFSRIFSEGMKREGDFFLVRNPIEFYASFLVDPMPNIVIDHLISDHTLRLGNEEYQIIDAKAYEDPVHFRPGDRMEMDVVALSPIVAYRTIYVEEKKKTRYFSPYDPEFNALLEENLKNKLSSIHSGNSEQYRFHIVPTNFDLEKNESVVWYKGFIVKGYTGKYHISGSSELLRVAYHTGLGSKNAQGFGMFRILG